MSSCCFLLETYFYYKSDLPGQRRAFKSMYVYFQIVLSHCSYVYLYSLGLKKLLTSILFYFKYLALTGLKLLY